MMQTINDKVTSTIKVCFNCRMQIAWQVWIQYEMPNELYYEGINVRILTLLKESKNMHLFHLWEERDKMELERKHRCLYDCVLFLILRIHQYLKI